MLRRSIQSGRGRGNGPKGAGRLRLFLCDERGTTSLEWLLLLGVIAIPGYWIIRTALNVLVGHYQMMTMVNSLPFP